MRVFEVDIIVKRDEKVKVEAVDEDEAMLKVKEEYSDYEIKIEYVKEVEAKKKNSRREPGIQN